MSSVEEIIKLKDLLDEGAITKDEFEEKKKEILEKSSDNSPKTVKDVVNKIFKVIGIIAVSFIILAVIISCFSGRGDEASETSQKQTIAVGNPNFSQEFPINISGKIENDILGFPEIECIVENTTDKNISAVQFYLIPYDVYGEILNSIFITNKLEYTDTVLQGTKQKISWQIIDKDLKSGTLYVYSIYFDDQTEWGDRNATNEDIMKYAYRIDLK